jgi:hypothetical protein
MDGDELAKLRKLTGQLHKLTYETAKADMDSSMPRSVGATRACGIRADLVEFLE